MNKKRNMKAFGIAILILIIAFALMQGYSNKNAPSVEKFSEETQPVSEEETIFDIIKEEEAESESLEEVVYSSEETKSLEEEIEKSEEKEQILDKPKDEQSEKISSDLEEEFFCMLSVRCDSVLENMEKLAYGKEDIIPTDGIIFPEQKVFFSEGESAFDILLREMKASQIHLEFVQTPMYNSAYIEGISNLYEFDCGASSGWQYRVNGVKPTYGCSQYKVEKGDKIEFFYSCNFLAEEN